MLARISRRSGLMELKSLRELAKQAYTGSGEHQTARLSPKKRSNPRFVIADTRCEIATRCAAPLLRRDEVQLYELDDARLMVDQRNAESLFE